MNKEPVKMTPGDDLHLTLLMAPQSLNFVTGQDREHLLAYGRSAFEAGQASKCLHQIEEPASPQTALPDVSISVQEWRDVCHQFFISHNRAPLIDDTDFLNSIAKTAVKKFAAAQPGAQGLDAARNKGINHGVCLGLQMLYGHGDAGSTQWEELVETAGRAEIEHYAKHIEPDEWELCGFAHLEREKQKMDDYFAAQAKQGAVA